jgi:hypothetical protein
MSRIASAISRRAVHLLDGARARVVNCFDRCFDPEASAFYTALVAGGYDPNAHIDVIPRYRLIYLCIPKCASTTIKVALSALSGRIPASFEEVHQRRHSGLKSPQQAGLSVFHRLAQDPAALRFAFVRNPYDRLVSAWADKYRNKPLLPGDSFIDKYLGCRKSIDPALPAGTGATLSFADFVRFAAATADRRLDAHWQLQDDILAMPGIALDYIGKVESFDQDFARVMAHAGAPSSAAAQPGNRLNQSAHRPWPEYYSSELADCIYRTYERDFDRLRYPRTISGAHAGGSVSCASSAWLPQIMRGRIGRRLRGSR